MAVDTVLGREHGRVREQLQRQRGAEHGDAVPDRRRPRWPGTRRSRRWCRRRPCSPAPGPGSAASSGLQRAERRARCHDLGQQVAPHAERVEPGRPRRARPGRSPASARCSRRSSPAGRSAGRRSSPPDAGRAGPRDARSCSTSSRASGEVAPCAPLSGGAAAAIRRGQMSGAGVVVHPGRRQRHAMRVGQQQRARRAVHGQRPDAIAADGGRHRPDHLGHGRPPQLRVLAQTAVDRHMVPAAGQTPSAVTAPTASIAMPRTPDVPTSIPRCSASLPDKPAPPLDRSPDVTWRSPPPQALPEIAQPSRRVVPRPAGLRPHRPGRVAAGHPAARPCWRACRRSAPGRVNSRSRAPSRSAAMARPASPPQSITTG